jgi:hypothetical protein
MVTDTPYSKFLDRKSQLASGSGFSPIWMPDSLFPFQQALTEWAIRRGRAALFEDCGLGKTFQSLVWAENVVRHTNQPVLILTPLAVGPQTVREAEKFSIEAAISRNGKLPASKIVVTNYERLHHFNSADFAGIVCDESSILKNFAGKTRAAITEFMRTLPYRLLCTATAAPNDFWELGTSSEALGMLGYSDMLTQFFKQDTVKDMLGWGRTTYRFRGHAEQPFWRWVCSWARACRKPSDLGFEDDRFTLPPLDVREVMVKNTKPLPGMLFAMPARGMKEERAERKQTLKQRCELAAGIAEAHPGASAVWCHLNAEGDLLAKLMSDCTQVSGSQSLDAKEERLLAFQAGQIKRLVIKPKVGCFGLNWQHCHNVITFASHSFEQYYQLVRRCWRFGQLNTVKVSIVTTEGEAGAVANANRKSVQCDRMFDSLVGHMNNAISIDDGWHFSKREVMPSWI